MTLWFEYNTVGRIGGFTSFRAKVDETWILGEEIEVHDSCSEIFWVYWFLDDTPLPLLKVHSTNGGDRYYDMKDLTEDEVIMVLLKHGHPLFDRSKLPSHVLEQLTPKVK